MNQRNIDIIFENYITKFEVINNRENNETYKWAIAANFRTLMDEALAAPNCEMYGKLMKLWKLSENLIDNKYQQSFYALCSYAREEPNTIRNMLRALFADDSGDLKVRQEKVLQFLSDFTVLNERYSPGNWRYCADQRAVMSYMALYDPENNYMYKATQANKFAEYVGFYDDWGSGTSFNMDAYYRMCNALVECIKENKKILVTHQSRYEASNEPLHEDRNYHILAFDIIYCCSVYGLLDNVPVEFRSTEARRLAKERHEKAEELRIRLDQVQKQMDRLLEAKQLCETFLVPGTVILHKSKGTGRIKETGHIPVGNASTLSMTVIFDKDGSEMRLLVFKSFIDELIQLENAAFSEKVRNYFDVMKREYYIPTELKNAEVAFAPYAQYVNN